MGTIADKFTALLNTKTSIKNSIIAKGVSVPENTPFNQYPNKINLIDPDYREPWTKPSEWLNIPNPVDGTEKIYLLVAVYDSITTINDLSFDLSCDYTVDWGDGTSDNYVAGATSMHSYNFNNVNLNSNTLLKYGYKQCLVTITGVNIQGVNFCHTDDTGMSPGSGTWQNTNENIIAMSINIPNSIYLMLGVYIDTHGNIVTQNQIMNTLKYLIIGEINTLTHLNGLCYNMHSLEYCEFTKSLNHIGSYIKTFMNCYSLQNIPITSIDTTATLKLTSMYSNCLNIVSGTLSFKTSHPTSNMSFCDYMFEKCSKLSNIILNIDVPWSFYFRWVFQNSGLKNLILTTPTGKITSLINTFENTRLKKNININTSLCEYFNSIYLNCLQLEEIDNTYYDFNNAISITYLYSGCTNVSSVIGEISITTKCTALYNIYHGCYNVHELPKITGSYDKTSFSGNNPYGHTKVKKMSYNIAKTNDLEGFFTLQSTCEIYNTYLRSTVLLADPANLVPIQTSGRPITRFQVNYNKSFDVSNGLLNVAALDEMFTALPTAPGQTVTITGNPGVSGCNKTIATAKGWTVVSA